MMKRGDSGGMSTSRRGDVVLNARRVEDVVEVADGKMAEERERSGALGNVGAIFGDCCSALFSI